METTIKPDPDQLENISRNELLLSNANTTTKGSTKTNKVSKPPLSTKSNNTLSSSNLGSNKNVLKGFILNTNVPLRKETPTASNKLALKIEPGTSPVKAQLRSSLPSPNVASPNEVPNREKVRSRHKNTNDLPSKIPKDPGKFTPFNLTLLEANDGEIDSNYKISQETFKEIFFGGEESTEEDLTFCKTQGTASFKEWVEFAERLNKKQLDLIKELVRLKIELSFKFSVILQLINSHAESLVKRGDILDDKYSQIQRIGEDILRLL